MFDVIPLRCDTNVQSFNKLWIRNGSLFSDSRKPRDQRRSVYSHRYECSLAYAYLLLYLRQISMVMRPRYFISMINISKIFNIVNTNNAAIITRVMGISCAGSPIFRKRCSFRNNLSVVNTALPTQYIF